MVPICLAIGVFLPLPFMAAVSTRPTHAHQQSANSPFHICSGTSGPRLASRTSARLSSCSTHATSPSVSTPPSTHRWRSVSSRSGGCGRATRAGSPSTSASVSRPAATRAGMLTPCPSYIVAAALDGGTQVISFILNFAVFGASGTAHNFPEWWGNGTYPSYRLRPPEYSLTGYRALCRPQPVCRSVCSGRQLVPLPFCAISTSLHLYRSSSHRLFPSSLQGPCTNTQHIFSSVRYETAISHREH